MSHLVRDPAYPMAWLSGADMTLTTDQAFTWLVQPAPTLYVLRRVLAVRKSGAFGVSCLGGIYTAATKGGNALVAATQTFAGLTIAGTCVDAALAAIAATVTVSASTLYLSLTTGNTGALTADVYLWADVMT